MVNIATPPLPDPTLSSMRRTAVLLAASLLSFAVTVHAWAAPSSTPSVTSPQGSNVVTASIDSHPAQTISGFGVSDDHWADDLFHFPPAIRGRVVAMLFSPVGLDLGAYRYTIGGGRGGDWFLRQAAEHGIRNITAYANSAPGRFTTNGRTCGGWLRPNDVDT